MAAAAALSQQPRQPHSRVCVPVTLAGGITVSALYNAGTVVSMVHEKVFWQILLNHHPKKLHVQIILGCENGTLIPVKPLYVRTSAFGTHGETFVPLCVGDTEGCHPYIIIEDQGLLLKAISKPRYFSQSEWSKDQASFSSALNVNVLASSSKTIKEYGMGIKE